MKHDYRKIQISHMNVERRFGNTLIRIKPGVLCVFDRETPSNSRHYHNCYELCIVTDGAGCFLTGDGRLEVKKGDVFIAAPGGVHEITIDPDKGGEALHVFHFSISLQESGPPEPDSQEEACIRRFVRQHDLVRSVSGRLILHLDYLFEYTRQKHYSPLILELVIVHTVLDSFSALTRTRQGGALGKSMVPSSRIDDALLYIARHLNERITLEAVAGGISASKRTLQLLFRQHLDATVTGYINRRKMSVASSYLRMNFRVRDVGPKVGISDPAQFCRVFKKYYGMTPKKYQMTYSSDGMTFAADFKQD